MFHLVYEKASGLVVGMIEADAAPAVLDHHATMQVDKAPADFRCVAIEGDKIVHRVTPEFITGLKAGKRKAIERARDAKLAAGFQTECGLIQADPVSRTNLTDAAMRAMLAPVGFKVRWRMADNKMVELTAAEMTKLVGQLSAFVDGVYQRSFALKAQLDKLTKVEDIKALAIDFS